MLKRIYTIGHSTRSLLEFVRLLKEHGVTRLADIRRFPGSRRHPHFAGEALAASLPRAGLEYVHLEALGGRRKPARDSQNMAWESDQFRGYADHMASAEFRAAVERLLASERETAYMCAEAVPWRCHRSLIADALLVHGIPSDDIASPTRRTPHKLTPFARVDGVHITYPALDLE